MTDGRMMGMTARKVKISISIDATLLANVDRYAAVNHVSRSAALERWVGQVSHREKLNRLEEETAVYYESLTDVERREDVALAAASSRHAKKLDIDAGWPASDPAAAPKRSTRRKPK
jgi:metal-responsive CopG/Arc/MetJ family transcriptional regulator